MPLPGTWNTVTVTATFLKPDGTPASGSVQFTAVRAVGMDDTIVLPHPITAVLDGSGQITASLPCPDDAGAGFTTLVYKVIERIPFGREYFVQLDNTMTAEVLGDLDPLTDDQAAYYSLRGPTGPEGDVTPEALAAQAAAEAAASAASASATAADGSADAAAASAGASSASAIAAAASIATGDIYLDTAAGLAATTTDQYFSVPSPASAEYLILYRNNAGSAVEVKRYPSKALIDSIEAQTYRHPIAATNTAANAGGNQALLDRIRRGVLAVTLQGNSTSDTTGYYIERLRRNYGGNHHITIKRATDGATVSEFFGPLTEPADPTQPMVVTANTMGGSGIIARVLVRWSEFEAGVLNGGLTVALAREVGSQWLATPFNALPSGSARAGIIMAPVSSAGFCTYDPTTGEFSWPDMRVWDGAINSMGYVTLAAGSVTLVNQDVAWLDLSAIRNGTTSAPASAVKVGQHQATNYTDPLRYTAAAHQLPLAWRITTASMRVNPMLRTRNAGRAAWKLVGGVYRYRREGTSLRVKFKSLYLLSGTVITIIDTTGDFLIPQDQMLYIDLAAPLVGGKIVPAIATTTSGFGYNAFHDDMKVRLLANNSVGLGGELAATMPELPVGMGHAWIKGPPCNVTWNPATRTLAWDGYLYHPIQTSGGSSAGDAAGSRIKLAPGSVTFNGGTESYQVAYLDMYEANTNVDTPATAVYVGQYMDAGVNTFRGAGNQVPLFAYEPVTGEFRSLGGFPIATEVGSGGAITTASDDDLVVEVGTDTVSIFVKGSNPTSAKYMEQVFRRTLNLAVGDGSGAGNVDIWHLGACYESTRTAGTTTFTRGQTILNGGEIECAIHEVGAVDYIGGVHGDEILSSIVFFVDGKEVSLASAATIVGREVAYRQVSTLYQCGTTTPVATHVTHTTIRREGGQLRIHMRRLIDWQASLVIRAAMLTMLPILRHKSGTTGPLLTSKAMRSPNYAVEDVSTVGFSTINTLGELPRHVEIWGPDGYSAEVEIVRQEGGTNKSFYVSNSDIYNKLYYSFAGNTLSAAPETAHTTTIGEKWNVESIIRLGDAA